MNGIAECSEGNFFASICNYRCNLGYEIGAGSSRSRCEADQEWSQEKAVCEKIICADDNQYLSMVCAGNQLVIHYIFKSVFVRLILNIIVLHEN